MVRKSKQVIRKGKDVTRCMEFLSSSVEQTQELGKKLAQYLQPGDVVLLYGDMGAGKSELSRGIARGLGIEGPIASPTFTIMQMYETGKYPLYHFDWYRLASSEELFEMGMDEYLGGNGIALVEWPTQAADAIPETYLQVSMSPCDDENKRRIVCTPIGGFHQIPMMPYCER